MSGSAPVTILYFAWLRERAGVGEEQLVLPPEIRTVSALIEHLAARDAGHAAAFQNRHTVRYAVNQDFAGPDTLVRPGDEVAFFPPVTGG
jgi:molybdopterin synthase sulfur carrier subunit